MNRKMSAFLGDAGALSIGAGVVTTVTAAAATYYLSTRPEPNVLPTIDLNDQAVVLEVVRRFYTLSLNFINIFISIQTVISNVNYSLIIFMFLMTIRL